MNDKSIKVNLERVNRFVLGKQHLTPDAPSKDILQIVRDVAGLHATVGTTLKAC